MEVDIPDNIRVFIDEFVDSFAMWDLLIYCSKSESQVETPKRVAEMLGRPSDELAKPVVKLEKLGLLEMVAPPGGPAGFLLNRASKFYPSLEKFWTYNEVQENRLRILSYLLQKKTR